MSCKSQDIDDLGAMRGRVPCLLQVGGSRSSDNSTEMNAVQLPPEAGKLAEAAFELAAMSLTGLAEPLWPKNVSLGLELLNRSAQAGALQAKLALAYRHLRGDGVPEDHDRAFRQVLCLPGPHCLLQKHCCSV